MADRRKTARNIAATDEEDARNVGAQRGERTGASPRKGVMPSVISQEARMITPWIAIALGVALVHWADRAGT